MPRGRPTKQEMLERERRKKAWKVEEENRRVLESRIEQGLIPVISEKEYLAARDNRYDTTDTLVVVEFPPAIQFLRERLEGAALDQVDQAMRQAMIDLLRKEEIPLDGGVRDQIATELWKLSYPGEAKKRSISAKVEWIERFIKEYEQRGQTRSSACDLLAEGFGHASGDALEKWLKSHKTTAP